MARAYGRRVEALSRRALDKNHSHRAPAAASSAEVCVCDPRAGVVDCLRAVAVVVARTMVVLRALSASPPCRRRRR